MRKSDWVIALALALSAVVLAACGSGAGGGGDDLASREEAQLEFAECMREHGVDVPDPKPGQTGVVFGTVKGGPAGKGKTSGGINPEDPATKKALKACESKLPKGQKMSPQQEEKFKEAALAFSRCMREHGVNMPDPQFDGQGKVAMKIEKGGLDPSSPAFEEAQEACREKVPGGPVIGGPPTSR
ncbi:MAG TPA: hypothetical protein VHA80_01465 [Solirubrobacterales bacterium]|nr:hypothetical protein [Solirubrobacterales bacterium]